MAGVFMPRPISDLVILGIGQSSRAWPGLMAKFPGLETEVWTINSGGLAFRHDVLWDMHTEEYLYSNKNDDQLKNVMQRRKRLETHDKPIVMPRALPQYPTSMTYPLKIVMEATQTDYFTNGMAYMLALALVGGTKRLFLIGSDWIAKDRTLDEVSKMEDGRACVEYWLGRLTQAGCEVLVTEHSPVLGASTRVERKIYGYHDLVESMPDQNGKRVMLRPDYVNQ